MSVVATEVKFTIESGSWFSKKTKIVCLKKDLIQVLLSEKQKKNIFAKRYQDLIGVTKSLMTNQKNFVVHFKSTIDEEWVSNSREEIIKAIAERYAASEGKKLNIFGVSSKSLEMHCANEKDVKLELSKVPSQQFILQQ